MFFNAGSRNRHQRRKAFERDAFSALRKWFDVRNPAANTTIVQVDAHPLTTRGATYKSRRNEIVKYLVDS
jgi:hypothetical protein